jgi:hypothetical protein
VEWQDAGGTHACRITYTSGGRYSFLPECPAPLNSESGTIRITNGTYKVLSNNYNRPDSGTYRFLDSSRMLFTRHDNVQFLWVRVPAGTSRPPESEPVRQDRSYDSLIASARDYINRRGYRQALPLLEQAIAADPNRPEAYALQGYSYIYGLGDLNTGGTAYRKAYDLGGEITFFLRHDLFDGMFVQFRTGTLTVSRQRVSFRGDDGVNVFSSPSSGINEAKRNSRAFGVVRQIRARSPFHIKTGRGKQDNFNLAPTTNSPDQETDLILSFIGKD